MDAQASTASHQAEKWSPSPDASDIVKSVHAMLHPRNIVLVGATDKPGNYAERIWTNLIKYQYEGGLFPVNSKRETIWGVPCYKDFASLPEKPDHVLVLVPARCAVQVIGDAAAAGARSASLVTQGFSELEDAESQRLAVELKQAVKETGLAVTGPNCLGNLSAGEKLFTNIDDRIVTMEAGPVAIAGQSGAIVMAIRQTLEDRGVGVGYMVTTGNEAGLETPDLMRYFAVDPSVRVIVVYLEGVRNTKGFRDACKAARAAGKPVIALKLGASEGGRAAAMAHTGALAGSIETFDAISTREGVIRVRGLDELIKTLRRSLPHIAVMQGLDRAVGAIKALIEYASLRKEVPDIVSSSSASARATLEKTLRGASAAALDEVASKKLLKAYGIPVSKEEIAQTAADAAKIARKIGFPVVAKVVSAEILHKSDIGGVGLNLNSPAEVKKAFNDITARVKRLKGKPKLEGILIAQQVKAELELVVGTALDAEMGPVVLFGTGGVDIELMKDVALAGAPLDAAEARQLISRTKAGVKLKGYPGKPGLHEASAVKALVGLSNLMADAGTRIASIDVHPLLINTRTGVAVDALIVLNNAAAKSAAGH